MCLKSTLRRVTVNMKAEKRATTVSALFLAGLFATSSAQAEECLAPAPGISADDDSYYQLESSNLAPSERQLEAFATMLSGRWWGSQLEVICETENGVVSPVSSHYRIAAEFNEHFQGALRMEAERENSDAVKLTTIWFSPMYRKDRKGHELGWRAYNLTMPNSNTMVFDEKYRIANHQSVSGQFAQYRANELIREANLTARADGSTRGQRSERADAVKRNGFVRMVQDVKTLTLQQDSSLTIERKIYVSGHLVAEEGWILERDYFGSQLN